MPILQTNVGLRQRCTTPQHTILIEERNDKAVIAVSIKSTCTKWSIFCHYHSCIHKVSEVVNFFVIVIILLSVFQYATLQIQT